MAINNRNVCGFITQRCASLLSHMIHNGHKTTLVDMVRMVVDRMVCSSVNSKYGIKLSLDTPLKNHPRINILRPWVLHQYFGRNITNYLEHNLSESNGNDTTVKRYINGSGGGISSVDMAVCNFVTRKMSDTIECMADELNCIIPN